MIKIITLIILFFLLVSCDKNCNCEEKVVYVKSLCYETDSIFTPYSQKFSISNENYSYLGYDIINKWKDSLPQNIKDSLLNKKFIIHKTYFLSNIILDNEEKIQNIQEFNHKLETHLSLKIGHIQGIPTVLFSTSIENLNNTNLQEGEYFTIQIKRFLH